MYKFHGDDLLDAYFNFLLDSPRIKGSMGEFVVNFQLNFVQGYKKFLYNMYIPTTQNKTTEVDTVMLHETGIYIFETKNYGGWIFGSEKDTYWTQCLTNHKKVSFFNPVKQNNTHINALSHSLPFKIDSHFFKSYIVFCGKCKLKSVPQGSNYTVIHNDSLNYVLAQRIAQTKVIMHQQQIDYLYNLLMPYSKADPNIKAKHIKDTRNFNKV